MANNNSEVKRRNKIAVFRELLRQKRSTKPELAAKLHLSLPTVGQIVEELIEAGLVAKDGAAESIGGRRALCYRPEIDRKLALGVDITQNHIGFALVDLSGEVLAHDRIKLPYRHSREYDRKSSAAVRHFLEANRVETGRLVGVGYSIPGIVSKDRKELEISHILGINRSNPYRPRHELECEYLCFNDADAACMVECYAEDGMDDFVFLSLSNTVGGAMVSNKEVRRGLAGRCGELGHVCVMPTARARVCYCGKRGHYDAYGAAWLLAEKAGGSLEEFFRRLEAGDSEMARVFDEYLEMLAVLLENIAMFTDMPIVIGGYVGNYLSPYLDSLKEKIAKRDNLGFVSTGHIHLCRYKLEAAAVGSALYFIERFISALN